MTDGNEYSHWNYRVIRKSYTHPDGSIEFTYDVHEVYYDKDEKVAAWSEKPISPSGTDDLSDLRADLIRMHQQVQKTIAGDLDVLIAEELPGPVKRSSEQ